MKRLYILLPLLLLCILVGCGRQTELDTTKDTAWEILPEEAIFLRTSEPDAGMEGTHFLEYINGAGEIRTGEFAGTIQETIDQLKAAEPLHTLTAEQLDELTGHLRQINKNADFVRFEGGIPAALTNTIRYYAVLDGEEVLLQSEYWEPDYLDDPHAKAAVALHKSWEAAWREEAAAGRQQTTEAPTEVQSDPLLFVAQRSYERSEEPERFHFFCIKADGSVWTMDYSIRDEASGGHRYDFQKQLLSDGDAGAFALAEHVSQLGTLPGETLRELSDLLAVIDPDAEGEEAAILPDVLDDVCSSCHCFIPEENGLATLHLRSGGNNTGDHYRILDQNALVLLRTITESGLYQRWAESCDAENILVPDPVAAECPVGESQATDAAPDEESETFSDTELAEMDAVDDAVSALFQSKDFAGLTTAEKADRMLDLLTQLAESGTAEFPYPLIERSTIYYDGRDMISYAYKNGVLGGVKLEPFDPMMN